MKTPITLTLTITPDGKVYPNITPIEDPMDVLTVVSILNKLSSSYLIDFIEFSKKENDKPVDQTKQNGSKTPDKAHA